MMPEYVVPIANHLWQSTLFVAVAGALAMAFRKNRAALRYRIWLATSMKFLVPFSLFVTVGRQFSWRPAEPVPLRVSIVFDQVSRPFSALVSNASAIAPATDSAGYAAAIPGVLFVIWLGGFSVTTILWFLRWWRVRRILTSASRLDLDMGIPVVETSAHLEPGVFGVLKPVLLLPLGLRDRLTPPQLQAIFAHELCHVWRRDNLAAAVHSFIEECFWFHPLVWWIERRMIAEQERACDEEVLSLGHAPEVYAEGILEICTTYVTSASRGGAGIGGSDLKQRVHSIMTHTPPRDLSPFMKGCLAALCLTVLVVPILAGTSTAPQAGTRVTGDPSLKFEVASIRPSKPGNTVVWGQCTATADDGPPWIIGMRILADTQLPSRPGLGRCATVGVTLRKLIAMAYDYLLWNQMDQQIVAGPKWMDIDRFDVEAKAERPDATTAAQLQQMLQQLLAERFNLKVHRETRNVPGYVLVASKGGPQLQRAADNEPHPGIHGRPDETFFNAMPLNALTDYLAVRLGGPVQDKTGLTGSFTFTLRSVLGEHENAGGGPPPPAGSADPSAPSLFAALPEQLGLRLQSAKVPLPVLVVDSAVKPKEN